MSRFLPQKGIYLFALNFVFIINFILFIRHFFLKTIAFIYQGLYLNSKKVNYSKETFQLIESKLKPFVDEYIHLLSNEMASQSNPILNEVYHAVSRQHGESQLTKNFISKSGLVVDLLAHINDQSIGFVLLTRRNYCREPSILDGDSQFQLDMLQASGISTITVDCNRWKLMSDTEKEYFIKNEIHFAS